MADNKQIASDVLEAVGGKSNVSFVTHCMTRLRFTLKDRTLPNTEQVKKVNGVIGVQEAGGQYQVIIGQNVPKVYDELCTLGGFAKQDAIEENLDPNLPKQKLTPKVIGNNILNYISGSVAPLIPLLMCAGIFKVIGTVIGPTMLNLVSAEDDLYILMNMVYNGGFYFLPIYLGFNAAKKIGVTPILGALMGGMLIEPTFMDMAAAGESFSVFGIPCTPAAYNQTVVPILLTVWVMSYFEKFFRKYLPDSLSTVFVPVLTVALALPFAYCLLAPLGSWISAGIAGVLSLIGNQGGIVSIIIGGLLGGCWTFIVSTGMHLPIIMLALPPFLETGVDTFILAATTVRMWSLFATEIAAWLRVRNKEEKTQAFGYMVASILGGVGEPFIFGMMFRHPRLWLTQGIGSFFGSAVAIALGVGMYIQSSSNFLSILAFAGGPTENLVKAIIASGIGAVIAFALTYLFGFSKEELEGTTAEG